MELSNLKITLRTSFLMSVLFCILQPSVVEAKRFDAPQVSRPQYLAFMQPPTLRYNSSPLPVDRRKLILPPSAIVVTTTLNQELNATSSDGDNFPLIAFSDDNSSYRVTSQPMPPQNIPLLAPPVSLPLTDPFEDVGALGIDSTDELLQVFESSSLGTPRSSMQNIPFVPPYTVAPDNLRVTTRATYQRRQR
jgi:hypothetical protein